jgi:hypothetical protein
MEIYMKLLGLKCILNLTKIYQNRVKLAYYVILDLIRSFCLLEKVSTYSEPSPIIAGQSLAPLPHHLSTQAIFNAKRLFGALTHARQGWSGIGHRSSSALAGSSALSHSPLSGQLAPREKGGLA